MTFITPTAFCSTVRIPRKKMADFSEKALENVKTEDLGSVGDVTNVVTELKSFDAQEEEKGFFSF